MTLSAADAFLANIIAQYAAAPEKFETKVLRVNVTPEKLVKVNNKRTKVEESSLAPIGPQPEKYVPSNLPQLSGAEFLAAIRLAGRVVETERKAAERGVLERFGGYKFGEGHGTQIDNAVRRAKALVHGTGPDVTKSYGPAYIKGMPNQEKKGVLNLTGRLQLSLDEAASLRKSMRDGTEDAAIELKLRLEEERAEAIVADLADV